METGNVQENLFELLSKIKSKDGEKNLYEHLTKIFETQLEMNNNNKFLDLFEDISLKLKSTDEKYLDVEAERTFNSLFTYLEEFNNILERRKSQESLSQESYQHSK